MTFEPNSLRPASQRSPAIEAFHATAIQGAPDREVGANAASSDATPERDDTRRDTTDFSREALARARQKQDAESASSNQEASGANGTQGLSKAEQRAVQSLRQRDQEVRAHEQAHASAGGALTGAPQYGLERGPDGNSYAVSGEVSVALKEGGSSEETIRNAEQAKSAALAPARPSAQDQKVAARAQQLANKARAEQAQEPEQPESEVGQAKKEAVEAYASSSQQPENEPGRAFSVSA